MSTPPVLRWEAVVLTDDGDVVISMGSGTALPTASVGKLWLLVDVAEHIVAGDLDPQATVRLPEPVGDSGLWQHLSIDVLSIADAAVLVAAVSDNAATNALLDHVSLTAVARRADSLGAVTSRLHDRVRDVRNPGHPATLSTGTAAELAEAARRIHRAALGHPSLGISPAAARMVEGWLRAGVDTTMVLDPLALDPLAHMDAIGGIVAWSKSGCDRGTLADVGVVCGPAATRAYAAIASWEGDGRAEALEARRLMRDVGALVAEQVRSH